MAHEPQPSRFPQRVALFLTDRCNLRCVFCYTTLRREKHDGVGDFSFETFQRVFSILKPAPLWYLGANGEPLLCHDFGSIARFLIGKGKRIRTTTNGTVIDRLNREKNIIPWGKFDEMCVSVNEVTREKYAERMGADKFPVLLKGLKILKASKARFAMSFVVGRDNVSRLEEYGRFAAAYGVNAVPLPQMAPSGIGRAEWHLGLRELMHEEFLRLKGRKNVKIRFPASPIEYAERCAGGCHVSETYLAVDAAGNVAPCCGGQGPQPGTFGNLFTDGLAVWTSPSVDEYRRRVVGLSGEWPEECDGCRAQLSGGAVRWCEWS